MTILAHPFFFPLVYVEQFPKSERLPEHANPPNSEADLFLNSSGLFNEDSQEVHQEVNCNCKPETL
jgi:hypothetical protein